MFALFFSHSCPCWISWTLTCTFLFHVCFFGYFCQWLLIFACHPFLFRLNYLDHTHILYSNILILTLNTMAEPNLAKIHPTCANDHDGVRVCHWTIAKHSLLLLGISYCWICVNDTLLGHGMSCLKIILCPGLALIQTKWISTK